MCDPSVPCARVLIVGGGFSGASAAVQLVRRSAQPLAITVVEPRPQVGPGLAYSGADPDHRLNGPALTHAIDPAQPDGLLRWCEAQGVLARDPGAFSATGKPYVRRSDFGRYLADEVRAHAQGLGTGSRIAHRRGLAVAAAVQPTQVSVQLDDASRLDAELLIVATGNAPPRLRAPFDPALSGHAAVWPHPLDPSRPPRLPAAARVLVVGSGLTALDVLCTLLRQGHTGPIDVISRRGLRPRPQAPDPVLAPAAAVPSALDLINAELPHWLRDAAPRTARGWTWALRQRIRAGHARGETWHAGFDELRNTVWRAWPLLPASEQRRFLQRLRPWYDVHRFRTPPMTEEAVHVAVQSGQLRFRAARVQSVTRHFDGGLLACWSEAQGADQQVYDAAFNCTGLDSLVQTDDNPLLASLRRQALLMPDAAGWGFAVDAHGSALSAHGVPQPRLRIIGPPTAGTFGDPLGAMFIAAQVHRMLPDWLRLLNGLDGR